MKPYYQDASVKIFHADCREVLAAMKPSSVDLVLTDPPYGVDIVNSEGKIGGTSRDISRWRGQINTTYIPVHGDDHAIDPKDLLAVGRQHIIWGGNYIADQLAPSRCWLVWYKRRNNQTNNFGDCELAWTNLDMPLRVFQHLWMGMLRDSEMRQHWHPTQKPTALMRWCLDLVPTAKTVLDPYMGAGPVLRAAKDLGRKAVGIEIEEEYCEAAAKRMEQNTLGLGL